MTFRVRTIVALVATALLPLVLFGLGVRREMTERLRRQAHDRIEALTGVVSTALTADTRAVRSRLAALTSDLADDSRFRSALEADPSARRWLLDWAGPAMRLAGLDFLELVDSGGRILSSGHFRNDFDRPEQAVVAAVRSNRDGRALVIHRLAEGVASALVLADSFEVGGRGFLLLGGRSLDSSRVAGFAPGGDLTVRLATGPGPSDGTVLVDMPLIDLTRDGPGGTARIVVTEDPRLARDLIGQLDRWLILALGAVALLAAVSASWLGGVVARPVVDLAERTERIDLDRLDAEFPVERQDEVGTLARVLDRMTRRLRTSVTRLREAERRAAVGDLARQVNHDVKNGLAPIRHVVRHLTQVAEQTPESLASTYAERRATLESSIEYLDRLARNYAKLSPEVTSAVSDPNAIAGAVARSLTGPGLDVVCQLAPDVPSVRADPVVLRRILENLGTNAVEALGGRPGRVVVGTAARADGAGRRVAFSVSDTGAGIPPDHLDRIFDDFYTTKPEGTGLGLSVVKRLVADLGGILRVESEPGRGTVFTVEVPAS